MKKVQKQKKNDLTLMNVFWHYRRAYMSESKRKFRFLISVRILLTLVGLVFPFIVSRIIDLASIDAVWSDIVPFLRYMVFFYIFDIFLWRVYGFTNVDYQLNVINSLLTSSTNKLMHHSIKYFSNTPLGKISKDIDKYSWGSESWFDIIMFDFLPILIELSVIIVVVSTISWQLALLVIGGVGIYIGLQIWVYKYKQPYDEVGSQGLSMYFGKLADSFTNIFSVIYHGSRKEEMLLLKKDSGQMIENFKTSWRIGEWISAGNSITINLVEGSVFFIVLRFWSQDMISIGTVVLVYTYLFRLSGKIFFFSNIIKRFVTNLTDAKDMLAIIQKKPDIQDKPEAHDINIHSGQIIFDDVTFSYNKKKNIENFSLTIPQGQKIGLVGHSGAGKSTLSKLLMRLYDIDDGRITIDDQNIADITQVSLRQQISFVPQEPLLFHRTMRENICYGCGEVSDEDVIQAAKHAHAHEFIQTLENGYETLVGERGVKLSGGERQRVVIARAILQNNPILILDEATSALDSHAESLIQEALAFVMKGKTTLVIAHRLSTLTRMDRIIVMSGGSIAQDGTHGQLVAEQGLYKDLWDLQSDGFVGE